MTHASTLNPYQRQLVPNSYARLILTACGRVVVGSAFREGQARLRLESFTAGRHRTLYSRSFCGTRGLGYAGRLALCRGPYRDGAAGALNSFGCPKTADR